VEAVFHSGVEINLEGSDVNEIYDGMVEKVLEIYQIFNGEEAAGYLHQLSGWKFIL